MDVAQRLQQFRTLYGDFHCEIHEESRNADNKGGLIRRFRQAQPGDRRGLFHAFLQVLAGFRAISRAASILELTLERLDLLGECAVVPGQILDFSYCMEHGRMVASPEPATDLRQRAQR